MIYTVSILSEAEYDIDKAYIWYELRQLGLGDKFFNSVNKSIHIIVNNPLGSEKIYRGIRRFVIKRFPFGVYYRVNSDINEIQIVGVIHFMRNQRTIKKRI